MNLMRFILAFDVITKITIRTGILFSIISPVRNLNNSSERIVMSSTIGSIIIILEASLFFQALISVLRFFNVLLDLIRLILLNDSTITSFSFKFFGNE